MFTAEDFFICLTKTIQYFMLTRIVNRSFKHYIERSVLVTDAHELKLSGWAESEIDSSFFGWGAFIVIAMIVVAFFTWAIMSDVNKNDEYNVGATVLLAVAIAFVFLNLIGIPVHISRKKEIYRENEADWQRSLRVQEMFRPLQQMPSTSYPVTELALPSAWRPFRVEHFVSESLRGTLSGSVRMTGLFTGVFTGDVQGTSTPNLLDTSTMLFLQNEQGDTLRVLVPTPKATRQLLAGTIEKILKNVQRYTFTHEAIQAFTMDDAMLCAPISHPKIVDALDADCGKPVADRRKVAVIGTEIQPGVAVATALEVNGELSVFLPSGFFKELTLKTATVLELPLNPPQARAAV